MDKDDPEHMECPGCGYLMRFVLWSQAMIDFPCPRCEAYHLSEFGRVESPTNKD